MTEVCNLPPDIKYKHRCRMKYVIVYRDVATGIPLFVYDVGTPGNGRSAETIQSHLAPWSGIALMCDACQSYDWLKKVGVILCRCAAHGRREIERALKENKYVASYGIAFIQIIYGVEDQIRFKGLTGEAKRAYRNEHARLAWESLLAWCAITVHDAPEGSQLRKACNYIIRHYKELTAYLDLSMMPLDNNATESALRDMVMGKQNYLFCQNEQSCHYAAVMYSFFGTCKVLKINPEKWLTDVLNRLPHTPKEKLHELLPQVWIETHPEARIN
ncbi:MAG: transposase [Prevotella sp.]